MIIADLILGVLLVLAGRNLFWLCVGVVGFLVGVQFAGSLGFSDGIVALFAAIALGALGALLAICFEWLAVVVGVGFLGGGYLLMNIVNLFPALAAQGQPYAWPVFVVGGIIGTCLMIIIFDWTLIMISSLIGATLIAGAIQAPDATREIVFIGSLVVGIYVQHLTLRAAEAGGEVTVDPTVHNQQYVGSGKEI